MSETVISTGILLFLLAPILTYTSNGFSGETPSQDQQESSRFYALKVIYEKKVQNARDSLGVPDGRSAEILSGGQLVLLMEKILSPSRITGYGENQGCTDSGSVVGKGEGDYSLEGRFTWQDAQGEQQHEWVRPGPTATGFCIAPPALAIYLFEDNFGVDMIRITNLGTSSLFIDAVIGYEWSPIDLTLSGTPQHGDKPYLFPHRSERGKGRLLSYWRGKP
jgi:hypothetical protein